MLLVNLQAATRGTGEQPTVWAAGTGTDFSQGRLAALGLQAALGEPRGRGEPKAALAEDLWAPGAGRALQPVQGNSRRPLLILTQNRSAQVGEDVTKIASP